MDVDRAHQREQMRAALQARGADLTLFEDAVNLDKLWDNWYRNVRALSDATREGLSVAGLQPGLIDHILALKDACISCRLPFTLCPLFPRYVTDCSVHTATHRDYPPAAQPSCCTSFHPFPAAPHHTHAVALSGCNDRWQQHQRARRGAPAR